MKKNNIIRINGAIDSNSYEIFVEEFDLICKKNPAYVTIELCSEGGDTYVGLAFYAKIATAKPMTTVKVFGQCMSAATIILAAGDRRLMHKDAWFMLHDESGRIKADNGKIAISEARHHEVLEKHWAKILARHSVETEIFWREASSETSYFSAQELLQLGLINEIFG